MGTMSMYEQELQTDMEKAVQAIAFDLGMLRNSDNEVKPSIRSAIRAKMSNLEVLLQNDEQRQMFHIGQYRD